MKLPDNFSELEDLWRTDRAPMEAGTVVEPIVPVVPKGRWNCLQWISLMLLVGIGIASMTVLLALLADGNIGP